MSVKLISKFFRFFLVFLLILGILFRFINLEGKVYSHDEVHTSLRISGYDSQEAMAELFAGKIITPEDVLKFQTPRFNTSLQETIEILKKHPEHPPLYYLMARFWLLLFGSSVAVIRSLSAFISLLVFPSLYWLCKELFQSTKVARLAIALLAISPFHVLYAQEARQYSLWTATILLSSASLLRAIRFQKQSTNSRIIILNWALYAITLTLGFYASLFSVLVALAHLIYVVLLHNFRPTKTVINFLLASTIAVLIFSPWMSAIANNFSQMQTQTEWLTAQTSLLTLLTSLELNFSSIFIDIHPEINHLLIPRFSLLLFAFIGYSIYFVFQTTPKRVWLFILSIIGVTALAIILPDLIFGGRRATAGRYFIPSYLGIQLAVAYSLSQVKFFNAKIRTTIIAILIISGIISCSISSQAHSWWNKVPNYYHPQLAAIVNRADRPLLISDRYDINFGNLISLSYLLEPKVRLLLLPQENSPTIPPEFQEVFLFNPSPQLRLELESDRDYRLETVPIKTDYPFWKLTKN
jgi:uncharacterized membrane protein